METNKKTKEKEQRVVLNLSTSQAKQLNRFLGNTSYAGSERDLILALNRRIEKTLNKQAEAESNANARILIHGEVTEEDKLEEFI